MRETKVWLVGAGPGDPGLFTLKGRDILSKADIIFYDKLVGQGVLAMMPENAEKIYVGKVSGNHSVPQSEINKVLLEEAKKGKRVVRLKGGDPFVFGRGGEELELLVKEGIGFEVVPGITSAVSVPAYNGIPVTHRDYSSSFHVITGHKKKEEDDPIDYTALVKMDGTYIFLMGVEALPRIVEGLLNAGMDKNMPAALLENGTRFNQRRVVGVLDTIVEDSRKAGIKTPAIIVVGRVCQLALEFAWAEERSLFGIKVGITRPVDKASTLGEKIYSLGGEVVLMPSIVIEGIEENHRLDEALYNLSQYQWLAFTSPAGVKHFFDRLRKLKIDARELKGIKIAAVGKSTEKDLEEKGIFCDLVPEKFTGRELGIIMAKNIGKGEKVLLPRAKEGNQEIISILEEAGITFDDIPIYETLMLQREENLYQEDIDVMAFTSGSTVKAFVANNKGLDFSKILALCIGEETAKEANKYDMKIVVSKEASINSMIEKLKEIREEVLANRC